MTRLQTLKQKIKVQNPLDLLSYSGKKRVPLIVQSEAGECGLASLAMVSSYHGHQINTSSLRKFLTIDTQGMNLNQIMEIASELGLASRAIQCELHEIKQLTLPCILHWNLDHFVVLTEVSKKGILINDPSIGKRKLTFTEFSRCYTGVALELTPTTSFKKQDVRTVMKISQLWDKITGLKRSLTSLFLLSTIMQSAALFSPYYIQWVVDNVLMSNDKPLLIVLAIGFGLLALIQVVVSAFRNWLIIRFSSAINIQMGSNLFYHLIRLPMNYFEKRHIGDVISRFSSMSSIKELLTTGVIESIIDGLMATVVLLMMFLYSQKLTFLVIFVVLVSFLIQLIFYFPNRRITEEAILADAKEDSIFLESIRAIQTIKLFNHETSRQNTWLNQYSEVINIDIRLGKLRIAEDSLNNLIYSLETILVVFFGALAVIEGDLTIGMLLAFIAYKNQFTTNIYAFIDNMFSFKLLSLHLNRLSDITLEQREQHSMHNKLPNVLNAHLRVENLSFRYTDNSEWLFSNLTFEIQPGECIAIIGSSGCGKTTLMKLLLGLLKPTSGNIYIDNINIQDISLNDYRKHLGSVMQDDTLLSGTLSENITMFDSSYDEKRLIQCCKHANILEDIQSLPMGFHSLVGDMGNNFSGGQLQRIFLARALYKKPDILCLDESTSHLDCDNEYKINKHISRLDITRIIISHRKETIESADRVIDITK
ncbi:peptidase domain-containing ABC transporter [Aliivibrio sp. EL58]|uniref:peptidase domain-containing ABC transporter n=1 Tax=Aliivibrio sp. EL58 TaxID=2107582 RepID=UPI000EFBC2B5|nr:peptidase domain-containing ABC transporter [Aliivibrio sp. EL58]